MKVAGVKGIRLIMGAAKDERGSVYCNSKHLKSALISMKSRPRQMSFVRVDLLWCLQYCPCCSLWKILLFSWKGLNPQLHLFGVLFDVPLNSKNSASSEGGKNLCSVLV